MRRSLSSELRAQLQARGQRGRVAERPLAKSRHAARLLRLVFNPTEDITRASMAGAVRRASLLVQMLFYHVRINILQTAGQWVQSHA